MPVSRNRVTAIYCPGCGLSCHKGKARLQRHMKNQCKGRKTKARNR